MGSPACVRDACKGHMRYFGGYWDGATEHVTCVLGGPLPSPERLSVDTPDGLNWYELDREASGETEFVYRFAQAESSRAATALCRPSSASC